MSPSFPFFRPPWSERLQLCPIPPRLGSAAQSPDKSGILDDPPEACAVAAAGAALWAGRCSGRSAAAIRTNAEIARLRMVTSLPALLSVYRCTAAARACGFENLELSTETLS